MNNELGIFLIGVGIGIAIMLMFMVLGIQNREDVIENLSNKLEVEKAALELQTERVVFYEGLLKKVFGTVPERTYSAQVTVTAYSARPEETNEEPWYTADNTPSRVGVLAVSRDILSELGIDYGDTVILKGLGTFKVHDTMAKRWKRRVDILMAHPEAAKRFGKKETTLTWVGGE